MTPRKQAAAAHITRELRADADLPPVDVTLMPPTACYVWLEYRCGGVRVASTQVRTGSPAYRQLVASGWVIRRDR